MATNEADIRNAALEEAAKAVETAQVPGSLLRPGLAKIIRALKSAPAPVAEPKPFTFADPGAQREWERQRKERGE
jgi:hypothetical protein